jgi:hypothetical protein
VKPVEPEPLRLSGAELGQRIGRGPGFVRAVVEQLEREELASRDVGWVLTDECERWFGRSPSEAEPRP